MRTSAPLGRDASLVALAVMSSCLPYVGSLGFYSDDWGFLSFLAQNHEVPLREVWRSFLDECHLLMRPALALYLWTVYALFGGAPLPVHVVASIALAVGAVMLLLVLHELAVPPAGAFATAMIYALLPHYATARMWLSAHGAVFAMALYFLALYAELRLLRGGRNAWKLLSLAALVASLLLYEIFLPLFVANSVLVIALRLRRAHGPGERAAATLAQAPNIAAIVLVAAFKANVVDRLGPRDTWVDALLVRLAKTVDPAYAWQTDFGLNVFAALEVNYASLGLLMPRAAWRVVVAAPDPIASMVGVAIAAAVWLRLRSSRAPWSRRQAMFVVLLGLGLFALGYAIFLTNDLVQFSPSGIANRTAIAAALGVAVSLVGGCRLLAECVPRRWRDRAFAAGVAMVCACGSLVVSAVGRFWVQAYATELAVLDAFDRDPRPLGAGDTIILGGVCPFAGPAPVFESSWDFAPAVSMRRSTWPLFGHVVSSRTTAETDGLVTIHYGDRYVFPYSPHLVVYDFPTGRVLPLQSAGAASRYLAEQRPACLPSAEGQGVPVF